MQCIYVIGGPGSGKGRIVANLRSMFGMKLISSEALIFKYLPKKVQHAMTLDDTRAMAQLVRKDPSHVQVWVYTVHDEQPSTSGFLSVGMVAATASTFH